ncbi:hypothetical protein [Leifsonia sp. Leaf264]|uniref:hypothetical protein n=1 Tax=Leifsonia sp. Leaf264 TaxID=1736314 RepID=UPI0006FF05FE|nr:hypothetical protein [Leifsonia sp. Leaf264]KQO98491.1 hypothetical protein ASF30_10540 [Leifsonia sp. Leaf264]
MKEIWRHGLAVMLATAVLCGAGCTSGTPKADDAAPAAGDCINENVADANPFVACGDPAATRELVSELGDAETCEDGLEPYTHQRTTIAGPVGPKTEWCSRVLD